MSKRENLVLITNSFPQWSATEPSFVEPELDALRRKFRRVIVVPVTLRGGGAVTPLEGVETDTSWALGADWNSRLRRSRFLANPRLWLDARGDITRRGIAFGAAARAFASFLRRMVAERGLSWGNTLFYTFWFDFPAAALALLKADHPEIRFVSRAHGHDMFTVLGGRLRQRMLRESEAVYAASQAGADYLKRMFPEASADDKVRVSTLGCLKLYPEAVSARHKRADRRFTFLSVSRVDENKRVEMNARLLRALAVARPDTAIRWIHVGDGPSMAAVREAVKDCPPNLEVELRGALPNAGVQRIYRDEAVDWFMLLSLHEGGRAVAACEALAYGVPVVATDVEALNEVVDDECGLLLSPDSTDEEFVRGIAPYLDSDFRAEAMREAALSRWNSDFNAAMLRPAFVDMISHIE